MRVSHKTQDRKTSIIIIIKSNENQRPLIPTLGYQEQMVKQKGHRADALALRADERRDKLR